MNAAIPVLLLPLRIETKFVPVENQEKPIELRIRFYPDDIAITTHEPGLTLDEEEDGHVFWKHIAEAGDDEARIAAWATLASSLGHERAAWVAGATNPSVESGKAVLRSEPWSEAPSTEVMPEYLHVRGYKNARVVFEKTTSHPIGSSLSVGFRPAKTDTEPVQHPGSVEQFIQNFPQEVRWLVDFDEAEKQGLALRVPLTSEETQGGFDRILVTGVRASADQGEGGRLLAELLEGHNYTEGLSLVPQGTPTNSVEGEGAGFTSAPDPRDSYVLNFNQNRWEVNAIAPADERDGKLLAKALGLPTAVFDRIQFAEWNDQFGAFHMARALWPATWGYFLRQILADTVPMEVILPLRDHFVKYVRARGPLPAIRTGMMPYGILPVTSLERLQPREGPETWLSDLLKKLGGDWRAMGKNAPQVTNTTDLEQTLFEILSMFPTSKAFSVTPVFGQEFTDEVAKYYHLLYGWGTPEQSIFEPAQEGVDRTLQELGFAGRHPRLRTLVFGSSIPLAIPYLVDQEAGATPFPPSKTENYLLWLAEANTEELQTEQVLPLSARNALLYRILRHSYLTSLVENARIVLSATRKVESIFPVHEPEIVAISGLTVKPPVRILDESLTVSNSPAKRNVSMKAFLQSISRRELTVAAAGKALGIVGKAGLGFLSDLPELRESLLVLANLNKDQLQLLLTETLDLCSHRLDAWITSIATRRLLEFRDDPNSPSGLYLGAYGWVEDLRPTLQTDQGAGFVLTPSLDQANTASVLLNGHHSHRNSPRGGEFAVNLSSERVKSALWAFETIRAGHSIESLTGYYLERALQGKNRLARYISVLRELFPIDAGKLTKVDGLLEAVAVRNVLNGLALHRKWKEFESRLDGETPLPQGTPLFDDERLPRVGESEFEALRSQLALLDELFDAMADLTLAESVHHLVLGQFESSKAVTDAMAGSRDFPGFQFPNTRLGGVRIKHRVIVGLGTSNAPAWTPQGTPRAHAVPQLNRWLGERIGEPEEIGIYVRFFEKVGEEEKMSERIVTLKDLQIEPIDALEFAVSAGEPQQSELEQRVRKFILENGENRHDVFIAFDHPTSGSQHGGTGPPQMFARVQPLLAALRQTLSYARPAVPVDLVQPEKVDENPHAGIDYRDLLERASKALEGFWEKYEALRKVLKPFEQNLPSTNTGEENLPDAEKRTNIVASCAALSPYGVEGTIIPPIRPPPQSEEEDKDASRKVLSLAQSALEKSARRLVEILNATSRDQLGDQKVDEFIGNLSSTLETFPVIDAQADLSESQLRARALSRDKAQQSFHEKCERIIRGVFGRGFPVTVQFDLSATHHLRESYEANLGTDIDVLLTWLFRMGEIHPGVGALHLATLLSQVLTGKVPKLRPTQVPYVSSDPWVGTLGDGRPISPDTMSVFLVDDMKFGDSSGFCGLIVGAWEETIPMPKEAGGLAFHLNQPGSEPPQALLLAVSPYRKEANRVWDADTLFQILSETLDLVRVRCVDPDLMTKYGPLIPAIFLTENATGEAVGLGMPKRKAPAISLASSGGGK